MADMPVHGEPLAIDLVNTTFVRGGTRGSTIDALLTPGDLLGWVEARRGLLGEGLVDKLAHDGVRGGDLDRFRELRHALRGLCCALVNETGWDPEKAEVINRAVRAAQFWEELPDSPVDAPREGWWSDGGEAAAALSRVAASGVSVLAGVQRGSLRACRAPGCILFFMKDHPRREWCSTECGTRARVARHSRRKQSQSGHAAGP